MIQLSPPLVADTEEFEEIEADPARRCSPRPATSRVGAAAGADRASPGASRLQAGGRRAHVRTLVDEMGLELAGGEEAAEAPSAGCTSPSCPTRRRGSRAASCSSRPACSSRRRSSQREFARRLATTTWRGSASASASGTTSLPDGAASRRPSALGFPLFEVPYELPFIAITEKAFARLVNEQYEVLQRGIAIHKRLERLVLEERGLDELVRALSAAIGGAVAVLDSRGEALAQRAFRRALPSAAVLDVGPREVAARDGPRDGREGRRVRARRTRTSPGASLVLPVSTGGARRARRRGSWPPATPAASATSSG